MQGRKKGPDLRLFRPLVALLSAIGVFARLSLTINSFIDPFSPRIPERPTTSSPQTPPHHLLSCPKVSMSAISHLSPETCGRRVRAHFPKSDAFALGDVSYVAFKGERLRISQLGLSTEKTSASSSRYPAICTALVDERLAPSREAAKPPGVLAYDLVQGALVEWSITRDKSMPEPPTAVLLHGILGSRKNWGSFARRLAQEFPTWQFLSVDLRCHGDSATMKKRGPHTVSATALDVLKLVGQLRLTPRILIGHSFGGKVALSMVDQAAKPLARPVRVWVLDATPGKVRPGGHKDDHPAELIAFLKSLPNEVTSKRGVIGALVHEGFSNQVAQWVATNLRPATDSSRLSPTVTWSFDLNGIAELFKSYEETNLWKIVDDVPGGVHINFQSREELAQMGSRRHPEDPYSRGDGCRRRRRGRNARPRGCRPLGPYR